MKVDENNLDPSPMYSLLTSFDRARKNRPSLPGEAGCTLNSCAALAVLPLGIRLLLLPRRERIDHRHLDAISQQKNRPPVGR